MRNELEPLYEMIDKLEIAMMTTRRPDGHLESRAMATQRRAEGATCGSSPWRTRGSFARSRTTRT